MSEMVKRVSKAIAESDPEFDPIWDYTEQARAVIEAMREPTSEMLGAAVNDYNDHNAFDLGDASDAWQAMIDEALK